ncbi:MAG: proton-conducting transporter membrane subunit, partial [Candidatus Competibacterales bacterium]
ELGEDAGRRRFAGLWQVTLFGGVGCLLAFDGVRFYFSYTLMTFAGYGLVIHSLDAAALQAGRIYMILGVIGEGILLVALLLVGPLVPGLPLADLPAAVAATPWRDTIAVLVLVGFGIKMGLLPLHIWLPVAHTQAPVPASALLSGLLIKLGLLGWLRFLPLGSAELTVLGSWMMTLGAVGALYAAAMGVCQRRAKAVLAYSSLSQMGLVSLVLGIALQVPQAWGSLGAILLFFAFHHGLAKAALFLGAGLALGGSRWAAGLVFIPALALVGAPLTSGLLAKDLLKEAVTLAPGDWKTLLTASLNASTGATALLMARFLYLIRQTPAKAATQEGWVLGTLGTMLVASLTLPWLWAATQMGAVAGFELSVGNLATAVLGRLDQWGGFVAPVAVATLLATAVVLASGGRLLFAIPEGDILPALLKGASAVGRVIARLRAAAEGAAMPGGRPSMLLGPLEVFEGALARWYYGGLAWMAVLLIALVALAWR